MAERVMVLPFEWAACVRPKLETIVMQAVAVMPIAPVKRTPIDDCLDWLSDPARSGCYLYQYGSTIDPVSFQPVMTDLRFYFDDPQTAFEFKMRWG